MDDGALALLGLAKKAGALAAGEEAVSCAAEGHRAKLVLCARDASENTLRRGERLAQGGNAPWGQAPYTRTELGRAVGSGSCAILALTDIGLASAVCKRLAQQDEKRWGELWEELDRKAKKRLYRRKVKGKKGEHPARTGGPGGEAPRGERKRGPGGKTR